MPPKKWNLASKQGADCERHGLAPEIWRSDRAQYGLGSEVGRGLELPLSVGPLDQRLAGHIVYYFSSNALSFWSVAKIHSKSKLLGRVKQ